MVYPRLGVLLHGHKIKACPIWIRSFQTGIDCASAVTGKGAAPLYKIIFMQNSVDIDDHQRGYFLVPLDKLQRHGKTKAKMIQMLAV